MDVMQYRCAECWSEFTIQVTSKEQLTSLAPDRAETCPSCGQLVSKGLMTCGGCGLRFHDRRMADFTTPWHPVRR